MARPLRLEFPGALYHITSRGNARQPVFLNDDDCAVFIDVLCAVVRRYRWLLHSYCLMVNHYHLLVETPEPNLSRGMRQLNGVYAQRFNRLHERVGHGFQGRYTAILVEKDAHLLELCRYIALNPVRAGLVTGPDQWMWSSYRAVAGDGSSIPCLTTDWILQQFSSDRGRAHEGYREFVQAGIEAPSPLNDVKGQIFLGSGEFVDALKPSFEQREGVKEIPRAQRQGNRPSLQEIFRGMTSGRRLERDRLIYEAHTTHGYLMRELAEHLSVHYATVSRAIRRIENLASPPRMS